MEDREKQEIGSSIEELPFSQMGHTPLLPWLGVWRPP